MKVAHVIGRLEPGGVETWLLALFAETRGKVEHAVVVLGAAPGALEGALEGAAVDLGVRIVRCPLEPRVSFHRRFWVVLRESSPEVVHSHVQHASGWLLWLARRAGAPVRIAHAHVTDDGQPSTLGRRVYRWLSRHLIRRHATAGVAVASEAGEALFGRGWEKDPRLRVIPCGVDLERFIGPTARCDVRRELGFAEDTVLVGQLGRFHPVKNHAFTLRVAGILTRKDPRVGFVFIGDGPLRAEIEGEVAASDLGSRCAFLGSGRGDVPRLLSALDLLLQPSFAEGLPVSMVEAQAAGVRVVASASVTREAEAVPGLVRFVDLGAGPEGWADEVQAVLGLARPSGDEMRGRLARTDFDIRRSAGRFLELYGVA